MTRKDDKTVINEQKLFVSALGFKLMMRQERKEECARGRRQGGRSRSRSRRRSRSRSTLGFNNMEPKNKRSI